MSYQVIQYHVMQVTCIIILLLNSIVAMITWDTVAIIAMLLSLSRPEAQPMRRQAVQTPPEATAPKEGGRWQAPQDFVPH